jgi:hypothetical protein
MATPSKPTASKPYKPAEVKRAEIKPAQYAPPAGFNTKGKIIPKTSPAPKGKPTSPARPDVANTHEYLKSVKKEDIPSEMGRLTKELSTAQADKNYVRADQLKTAKAGLADKASAAGMKPSDFPAGSLNVDAAQAQTMGSALDFGDPLGARMSAKALSDIAAKKAKNGGYSLGNSRNEKGKCGEWLAKQDLHNDGYTDVMEVQNKSGHGVDVMGRNANGDVRVLEVKTTDGTSAPSLSKQQGDMGGKDFTDDRLKRAANAEGHYKNSPDAKANALRGQRWLQDAAAKGKKVSYEKYDMFIDDPKKGCTKKGAKSSPWDKKTPRSTGRR